MFDGAVFLGECDGEVVFCGEEEGKNKGAVGRGVVVRRLLFGKTLGGGRGWTAWLVVVRCGVA